MKPKSRYIITCCWVVVTLLLSVMSAFIPMNSVYKISTYLVNPFSWFLQAGTTLLWFGAVPLLGYFVVREFRESHRSLWIRSGSIGVNFCLIFLYMSASFGLVISGNVTDYRNVRTKIGIQVQYNSMLKAIKGEDINKIKRLLDQTPELLKQSHRFGLTPLHSASATGREEAVKILLQYNPPLDARAWGGRTPLHSAARFGRTDVVTQLLKHGCNPNVESERGKTPLHLAADEGHLSTVKSLVEAGADINAVTNSGVTPRSIAVSKNHQELNKYLKAHGAEEKMPNAQTKTESATGRKNSLFNLSQDNKKESPFENSHSEKATFHE